MGRAIPTLVTALGVLAVAACTQDFGQFLEPAGGSSAQGGDAPGGGGSGGVGGMDSGGGGAGGMVSGGGGVGGVVSGGGGVGGGVLSLGEACSGAGECISGYCVDDVCCNGPCAQRCAACSQAKTGAPNGQCQPVMADSDPDGECSDEGEMSCGADGTGCSGLFGLCNLYDNTTECMAGSCVAGVETAPSRCNGGGSCIAGTTKVCTPYVCNNDVCRTSCNNNNHCISGFECNNSVCEPR